VKTAQKNTSFSFLSLSTENTARTKKIALTKSAKANYAFALIL